MKVATLRLNRLIETPAGGRDLWAYTAGILEVTGMMSRQAFPLDRFYRNFSGHIAEARIAKVEDGYVLTDAGYSYFSGRFSTEGNQRIDRALVLQFIRGIVASQPSLGWETVEWEIQRRFGSTRT